MDLEMGDGVPENPVKSGTAKRRKQEEDASTSDHGNSVTVGESSGSGDVSKSSMSSNNANSPNSDFSYQDENDEMNDDDDDVDGVDEDDYDFYDNDDFIYEDDYTSMQDQFDHVDLPSGVEAPLPWLKDFDINVSKQDVTLGHAESSSKGKGKETEDAVIQESQQFKQFDVIESFQDHFYDKQGSSEQQRSKNWAKKIQEEWKILEENLPETIFVRVCESRMELLRAVIIGPSGTPYHDGLFFFDCLFPSSYPAGPPKVHYHSGGLRINPNLYQCGKVCLSLLGTWHGKGTENWVPEKSTMLQVLVSIQALILNEKPFFNEPGYSSTFVGSVGERKSKEYNENTFILSLKTMMYMLRKPPKHFEELVVGHFRNRAVNILTACKSYVEGNAVGSVVHNFDPSIKGSTDDNKSEFQSAVSRMMNTLIAFFTKNGSTDCEEFRIHEIYDSTAQVPTNLDSLTKK
ncbi:putative ubiquitin-conjugating enzyme E2 38 [Neltuma alba]|uniref:putative ubiquitin-conjugating enzyme E2 38 n=1 Tax=Neltuma alba TaxID=207710 RepID=UPI0010A51173|nr:putative ubiquitin-conjugating enzyme E2 38 [Prosopis alba]XP_028775392.1 putative ubiquitin-conjugating enzyme E2 38 [Prosopis alba]